MKKKIITNYKLEVVLTEKEVLEILKDVNSEDIKECSNETQWLVNYLRSFKELINSKK